MSRAYRTAASCRSASTEALDARIPRAFQSCEQLLTRAGYLVRFIPSAPSAKSSTPGVAMTLRSSGPRFILRTTVTLSVAVVALALAGCGATGTGTQAPPTQAPDALQAARDAAGRVAKGGKIGGTLNILGVLGDQQLQAYLTTL